MEICRDSNFCGGCVYQGVAYEEQLSNKAGEGKGLLDKKDIKYSRVVALVYLISFLYLQPNLLNPCRLHNRHLWKNYDNSNIDCCE